MITAPSLIRPISAISFPNFGAFPLQVTSSEAWRIYLFFIFCLLLSVMFVMVNLWNYIFAYSLDQLFAGKIRHSDIVLSVSDLIVFCYSLDRVLASAPASSGNTDHGIPRNCCLKDLVNSLASIQNHAKSTVNRFADTYAASIVESYQAHASGCISCIAVYCHICSNIGTIINIRCFSVWRICSACVMMVTTQHNRSDFSVSYHFVKFQSNVSSSQGILI